MVIAREHGHRRNEACALANLAESLAAAGQPAHALTLLDTWEIDPVRDSAYTITHHLDTRGGICLILGRYEEAITLFSQALGVAESRSAAMMFCEHLAEACEKSGDLAAALATYKQFHLFYCQVASEAAERNARVAAVRMETEQAKASAERERLRADGLQQLSLEDPLTGLANRRRLDDELAARYGGEEFAMLFRGMTMAEAAAAAERIRRAVEEYDWTTVAAGLTVTVSIGVAVGGESALPAGLLSLADHAGRNRVRISTSVT